jgi:hypothetical protein
MNVTNKFFYFGKINPDWADTTPDGWEDGWYFRFVIDTANEEVHLEDTCGRYVPLCWSNMYETLAVLAKVQNELLVSVIGAPHA